MSIRYKYLVLFPLTALLPILVFYYFTNHYITDGLMKIQQNRLTRDVTTVKLAFAAAGNQLVSYASTLSQWDEMRYLVAYQDTAKIDETMRQRFSDEQGEYFVSVLDDGDNVLFIDGGWKENETKAIASRLRRKPVEPEAVYSLEQIQGELAIVSMTRFTRDDGSGAPRGWFILAQRLDPSLIDTVGLSIKSAFDIYVGRTPSVRGNEESLPERISIVDWQELYTAFVEGDEFVWESDESSFKTTVFAPLFSSSGAIVGILKVASSDEDLLSVKLNLGRASIIIFAVVALSAVMLAFVLSYYLSVRITKLNLATQNVLSGDSLYRENARVLFRDELDELLDNFLRMKRELDDYLMMLIASEVKYRRVVNTSITGLFVYADRRYQFANPRFEEITGYTVLELNKLETLGFIHPADRDTFIENVVMRLGREPFRRPIDTRIITKKGAERIVNIRTETIDYDGEPALLGHVVEVTEQRELERRVFQGQKLEAIGTLAGGISHDFNNVIGGVIGLAEMLGERYPHDKTINEITERIVTLGRRGSKLVKNLLTFARGEITSKEVVDIEEILGRVLDIFILPRHLNIRVKTAFPATRTHVLFSPVQFEQMMLNLLVNARDAMPEGGSIAVTVDGSNAQDERDDFGSVVITVADDGDGIPQEYIGRIFDPFFTTKEVGKGTGLGLAVVYGIVEEHGGTIAVASQKGEGTIFTLMFPRVVPPDVSDEGEPKSTEREIGGKANV
jgi:PAS domain S-box-containing protein